MLLLLLFEYVSGGLRAQQHVPSPSHLLGQVQIVRHLCDVVTLM